MHTHQNCLIPLFLYTSVNSTFLNLKQLARGYAAAPTSVKVNTIEIFFFQVNTRLKDSLQAPITLFGLDGRYATALYTAAARQNALDAVEKDLKTLTQAVEKDAALKGFLENPTINRNKKMEGILAVLKKGGKPSQITENFFDTLAENGRLDQTSKVTEAFAQLMSAHRNELPLVVTSAKVR